MKGIYAIFITLIFIIFGHAATAQKYEPKLTFGLNFGRTFPIGKFAGFQDGLGGGGGFLHFQAGYLLNNGYTIHTMVQLTTVGNRTINNRLGYLFPEHTNYYNGPSTMLSFYPTLNKRIFFKNDQKKHWLNVFVGVGVEMNHTFYDRSYFSIPNSFKTIHIKDDAHFSPVFVLGISYEKFVYQGLFIKVLLDYQLSNFGTKVIEFDYISNSQNSFSIEDERFGWLSRISFGVGFGVRFPNIFKPKRMKE